MRLQLKFTTTKEEFPLEYRKAIMSFIKDCMLNANKSLFDKYYNNCNKKRFTFSTFIPEIKILPDKIKKAGYEFSVKISTSDIELGYFMINMFNQSKGKPYPLEKDNFMILTAVSSEKEETISSDTAVFKTLSPICLLDHQKGDNSKDRYYSVVSDEFFKMLKERYELEFINVNAKKTVIKHQGICIEATTGIFVLKGDPVVLNRVYQAGLGNRCGQGFGMLELLR